jgi:hypothetical protein
MSRNLSTLYHYAFLLPKDAAIQNLSIVRTNQTKSSTALTYLPALLLVDDPEKIRFVSKVPISYRKPVSIEPWRHNFLTSCC